MGAEHLFSLFVFAVFLLVVCFAIKLNSDEATTNFKSLLLRAEVLRKMNHYQSSLADVDNALKTRYSSAKAHYQRALVLADLGRFEEALSDSCLAIGLDRSTNLTTSELFQHDLAKVLQKLLAQMPKRRKQMAIATSDLNVDIRPLDANRIGSAMMGTRPYRVHRRRHIIDDDIHYLDEEESELCGKKSHYCDFIIDGIIDGDGYGYDDDVDMINGDGDGTLRTKDLPSRRHFRRKWATKERGLLPRPVVAVTASLEETARCGAIFRDILQRTQCEMQRLKKLQLAGESPDTPLTLVAPGLIDSSDFECILCSRTFYKPVVTPCGHTYCLVCLDRCMDYSSSCPLCKSPLIEPAAAAAAAAVGFVAKRPATKFLEAAMRRFIPEAYEQRLLQEIDMEPSVPVFICTTAFPYVACPLIVSDPRYRLMVRRAVESGEKQFGIVQQQSGKSRYYDIGTMLDIRDCVLLGDGRSILSTMGCKRFKILARNEKDGYETAKVEYIYDEAISDESTRLVRNMHDTIFAKAVSWCDSLDDDLKQEILQSYGEMPPVESNWESIADGPAWAWWIIALLPLNAKLKVGILETTSLEKRLRAIEKTLDCLTGSLRRTTQDCDVDGVCQQQQQQQQQQQRLQGDDDEQIDCVNEDDVDDVLLPSVSVSPSPLPTPFSGSDTDECCILRTSSVVDAAAAAAGATGVECVAERHHTQLML